MELFWLEHKKLWRKKIVKICVLLCFVYSIIFGSILSFQWFGFGSSDDYTSAFGNNFDITQQVQFSTYAVPMIIGEIKRYLRDNSAFRVTRSIRDLSYVVSQAKEKYIMEKNQEPTIDELVTIVGAPKEEIVLAIDSMVAPMSIYDAVYNDGGDQIFLLDQLKNKKDESEEVIDKIAVSQILNKLSPKERIIIEKRYFKDKTQTELAEELGVSQAQVSRIEKNALERIRKRIIKN